MELGNVTPTQAFVCITQMCVLKLAYGACNDILPSKKGLQNNLDTGFKYV